MPAELGSVVVTVVDTSWMAVNEIVYCAKTDGSVIGWFQVTAIGGPTTVTLKNLENSATGVYADNSAPGATFTIGSQITPSGMQGIAGVLTGAAGGDLKGTYPNPKIGIANTKGSSLWGNGTDTVAVPAGTNGHLISYDSTDAEGVKSFKGLPLTGDTNVLDNAIARLDGTTGLPIPMQASPVVINDQGAIQVQYGNAKGTDAVDLQATHSAITQVASGAQATIGGGKNNTGSGAQSTISGGDTNVASAKATTVGGGELNTASAADATVGGGVSNSASAAAATVGGGDSNAAGSAGSTIAGGTSNTTGGVSATVSGGQTNIASGTYSSIPGGTQSTADKHGQVAWSSGRFSSQADAQASNLIMRNATTNATPTELFLDGGTLRCTVPTGKSWMFQIMLVARKDDGLTSIYKSEGLITNVGNVVTMPAAATTTQIYDGIGLPATPVAVTADDPNNSLIITCTGVAATNIRWVARVSLIEVFY
jgi:hypothetical protein